MGLLALRDELRQESAAVVRALQQQGTAVYLLSGDNARAASAIGRRAGIDSNHVIAGVLPADKAKHIRTLQNGGNIVAMVHFAPFCF